MDLTESSVVPDCLAPLGQPDAPVSASEVEQQVVVALTLVDVEDGTSIVVLPGLVPLGDEVVEEDVQDKTSVQDGPGFRIGFDEGEGVALFNISHGSLVLNGFGLLVATLG